MKGMEARHFFGLVGVVVVSLEFLLLRAYRLLQATWEASFRNSGDLLTWWLIAGFFHIFGYVAVAGSLLFLTRRYYKPELAPILLSLLIDAGGTVVFWTLGTFSRDAYFSGGLASPELHYMSMLLFSLAITWLLIGLARLRLFSLYWDKTRLKNASTRE